MNSKYYVESQGNLDIYEGVDYQCRVKKTGRHPSIRITCAVGSQNFKVPQNRFDSTLEMIESGVSPDEIAKQFPVD